MSSLGRSPTRAMRRLPRQRAAQCCSGAMATPWSAASARRRDLPAPVADLSYAQAAAEARRAVLLRRWRRGLRLEQGGSA